MRILSITPEPFFQQRGTPFSIFHRVRAMCELGHKIDILTYHIGEDVSINGSKIYRIWKIPFIKEVKIGPSFKKLFLDFFLFFKAIYMLAKNDYEVIHAHEEAAYFSVLLKKIFKVKLLYDMHSNLSQQLSNFNFTKSKLLIAIFNFLDRLTICNSDAIITICPDLSKAVTQIDKKKKYFMIENSLISEVNSVEKREAGDSKDYAQWERINGKDIIFYAGTFEHYQGIPMLLKSAQEVIKEYKNVIFVLAGGNEKQVSDMQELAKLLHIEHEVLFTGTIPHSQVNKLIERSAILVSPRIKGTNTPLKIYSYLNSGKPIVATNLYTHRQVLNEEVAVLTELDPVYFAEGIKSLLKDAKIRENIGRRAKKYYDSFYGEAQYKIKLEQVIKSLQAN